MIKSYCPAQQYKHSCIVLYNLYMSRLIWVVFKLDLDQIRIGTYIYLDSSIQNWLHHPNNDLLCTSTRSTVCKILTAV